VNPKKCERFDWVTVRVAICGAGRAVRSAHGGGDRGATAGNAGVYVHLRPGRLAHSRLMGAAAAEEHRSYEEER